MPVAARINKRIEAYALHLSSSHSSIYIFCTKWDSKGRKCLLFHDSVIMCVGLITTDMDINDRYAYKLFKSHCNSGVRSQFFAERVVKVWNSLPTTTNFATLPVFRQSIMCVDFSAFLKVFLIFQFVSYCYLLYCLDTGTLLKWAKTIDENID